MPAVYIKLVQWISKWNDSLFDIWYLHKATQKLICLLSNKRCGKINCCSAINFLAQWSIYLSPPLVYIITENRESPCMMATSLSLMATGGCPDNLRCHAWRQNWYHNNSQFGMVYCYLSYHMPPSIDRSRFINYDITNTMYDAVGIMTTLGFQCLQYNI